MATRRAAAARSVDEPHGAGHGAVHGAAKVAARARALHRVPDSHEYSLSVQRALAVPVARAWQAFAEAREVTAWAGARHRHDFREGGTWQRTGSGSGTIRRIVPNRFLRLTWQGRTIARGSILDVEIRPRGDGSCNVKLTHHRIPSEAERQELRLRWSGAMDALKSFVEVGAVSGHG